MHVAADNRRITLLQLGRDRLSRLCSALGFDERDEHRMNEALARMGAAWGAGTPARLPRWPSDICDDGSPFELSVALDGARSPHGAEIHGAGQSAAELRILAEVQAPSPNIFSNWRAALAFTEDLEPTQGLSIARLRAVQELFAPTLATRRFALWHALCFRPGELPDYKVYLNPAASGQAAARATVEQALSRLGFPDAGAHLPPTTPSDRVVYFSLDLPYAAPAPSLSPSRSEGADDRATERPSMVYPSVKAPARVKVYTAHHEATPRKIESALASVRGYQPGRVAAFCEAMAGGTGPYHRRPVQTCLSFTAGSSVPTSGTVYFPVRSYADTDLEVKARVMAYLPRDVAAVYERALGAHATRPLEDGVGMQTYLSLREGSGPGRVTVYLSPEIYTVDRSAARHHSGVVQRSHARKSG